MVVFLIELEEVMEDCGLARGEAELLILLFASLGLEYGCEAHTLVNRCRDLDADAAVGAIEANIFCRSVIVIINIVFVIVIGADSAEIAADLNFCRIETSAGNRQ